MSTRVAVALAGLGIVLGAPAFLQGEVLVLQNDTFSGVSYNCRQGLGDGMTVAARFTAPATAYPYTIQSIQILTCGTQGQVFAVDIWNDTAALNPGTLLWSSGATTWAIGPPSTFTEIVLPQPVVVSSGTIRVGLYHHAPASDAVGVGLDGDGITMQRNLLQSDAGVWQLAENAAVSGDFIFRLLVDTDTIFQDGFESGSMAAWSTSSTDGGDLAVDAAAALRGSTAGLRGVVDDQAGLYVADERPQDAGRYRARFHFDPQDFDPGEAENHLRTRLFLAFEEAPVRRLAAIVLRRREGVYSLMGRARLDDDSQANTPFFGLTPGPHVVEFDWKRSSGPDAADGTFQMWIDNASVFTLTGLDNSRSAVDFVRLGALSVKSGASGTLYWDEFVSRRSVFIGP